MQEDFHSVLNCSQHVETNAPDPLMAVLQAQAEDDRVTSYPAVEDYAASVVELCERLDRPILWPVGSGAERLAGAVTLLSRGGVRVRGWSDKLDGESVLLLGTVAVSPIELISAAGFARLRGASLVSAAAIDLGEADAEHLGAFDGYTALASGPDVTRAVRRVRTPKASRWVAA